MRILVVTMVVVIIIIIIIIVAVPVGSLRTNEMRGFICHIVGGGSESRKHLVGLPKGRIAHESRGQLWFFQQANKQHHTPHDA